jgi:hypothetical protein
MFLLQQLLPGMLVAGLLSGVFALGGRLWKADNWADALALAIGYAGGHAMTTGWPPFPAAEATQWLPYFGLAAMCLGTLDALLKPPRILRAVIWILFCAALLRLLLTPKFQYGWSLAEGVIWITGLAAIMLVLGGSLDVAAPRRTSVSSLLILTIVAFGTGAALMLSGSMLLAQLAMVFGTALGAILLVAFLLPQSSQGRGVVPVAVALLMSLWLSGYFYAELPSASALLLAAAPLPALLLISLSERKRFSLGELVIQAAVVVALVGIAVLLAFHASPPLDR